MNRSKWNLEFLPTQWIRTISNYNLVQATCGETEKAIKNNFDIKVTLGEYYLHVFIFGVIKV